MTGDREVLKNTIFENSKLFKKTESIIFVPYIRKKCNVLIFPPILCGSKNNQDMKNKLKVDVK